MTCMHRVSVGDFCRYCGTTVDTDLVRALAFVPAPMEVQPRLAAVPVRDPDIELFEECRTITAGECGGCGKPVLVSADGWTKCKCGSQTTLVKDERQ